MSKAIPSCTIKFSNGGQKLFTMKDLVSATFENLKECLKDEEFVKKLLNKEELSFNEAKEKFSEESKQMKRTSEGILITIAAELDTIKEILTSNLGYIKDVDDDTELVVANIESMIDMAIRTKSQIDRMLEKK